MFTVGEFSQLAQVSKRLLRYYDEIDLFKPVHIDRFTGYRYYSAEQVSLLNRILALKDLGLSLEQIQQVIREHVSTDEIQEMLLRKKAEVEQQLQEEFHRLRKIESRLQAIRDMEANRLLNVVLKHTAAQPILSVRTRVASFTTGLSIFNRIEAALPEKNMYGFRFCICHSDDIVDHDMDLEMGYFLEVSFHDPVPLDEGLQLCYRELPEVDTMATFVVKGPLEAIHTGYTEIGVWAEVHGYRFAGTPREITLQAPQTLDGSDLITEIQFPVESVRHEIRPDFSYAKRGSTDEI